MAGSGGVYKRGKQYWLRYSIGGQQFREPAKTTSKRLAEELLRKKQTEVFEGRHFPDKRRGEMTVGQLRERWLQHAQAKGKASLSDDATRFRRIVDFLGENRQLASITRADVEDFVVGLRAARKASRRSKDTEGKPLAPATINRHIALLRAALNYALEHKYIHENPAHRFRLVPENNKRDRICSTEEYERIIEAAYPPLRLAVVIGYHTGMRLGEIAGLQWDQIDLKDRVIRLRAADTKNRQGRTVPIAPAAWAEIRDWPRQLNGALLCDKASKLSGAFSDLARKLCLKDLRFHDLRHTAATNMRRSGVDIFTIRKITGHKTLAMLERYNTIDIEDLHAAMEKTAGGSIAHKS